MIGPVPATSYTASAELDAPALAVSGPPRRRLGLSRCMSTRVILLHQIFVRGRHWYQASTSAYVFRLQNCSPGSGGRSKNHLVMAIGNHVVILGRPRPRFLPCLKIGCRHSSFLVLQPITAGNPQTDLSCSHCISKRHSAPPSLAGCFSITCAFSEPQRRPIRKFTLVEFPAFDPLLTFHWMILGNFC